MKIQLSKFGTTLISRQSGREAYSAFLPTINTLPEGEEITVDFAGIITFSPSWGDEFISKLYERFGDRLVLQKSDNPSVLATIDILEQVLGKKFIQR